MREVSDKSSDCAPLRDSIDDVSEFAPSHPRSILAIEGPSLSGKTTLIARILAAHTQVFHFGCYVEALGASPIPPFDPGSTAGQVEAFLVFAQVEAERSAKLALLDPAYSVLFDRSIDSLLAHAYALDKLRRYDSLPRVRDLAAQLPVSVPDATFFLDAAPSLLRSRLETRMGALPPMFIDDEFVAAFKEFFELDMQLSPSVTFIDAASVEDVIPLLMTDFLLK
ncbi:hypothetical protein [Leifsonia sp. RAF41]|uniref:hypothetical protein n=1 Tax=Leifsonia sp. RAF41 TaxID=3233056 RepID=UPI003F9E56F0